MDITFKETNLLDEKQVGLLYRDANWTSYTEDMPRLMNAIKSSLMVITAWEHGKLIGLVRVVGDGLTIIYFQDLLVLESCRNRGIGSKLLKLVLEQYKDVRQTVLLTDESEEVRSFYEKNGFSSCDKGDLVAFAKFNKNKV
ncbi:GNAT family N-acetyltransferase [Metabacillus indicus]|uniref:GNAT family N-acetyltransferase n=1 Tax=Metabacillus indicus TaxID=246786 RepID=UPI002A07B2CB|nr:GNAT family N-acetyltransferase [Metabacillus indicus]MDX8289316.1 GNAT family N-acetyltransferase [Metabacillus indicus]